MKFFNGDQEFIVEEGTVFTSMQAIPHTASVKEERSNMFDGDLYSGINQGLEIEN